MKKIYGILMILFLTGCATTREQFDCKYGIGVGCKSITEVNQMVNDGLLRNSKGSIRTLPIMVIPKNSPKPQAKSTNVVRVTEEHLRVWIAPYQDDKGHFHEGAVVHTVLRPGFWQVEGEV